MDTHKVIDDYTTTFTIDTFKDKWIFTSECWIVFPPFSTSTALSVTGSSNRIMFNGQIGTEFGVTMAISGKDTTLHIGESSAISGAYGITTQHGITLINDGSLSASALGQSLTAITGSAEKDIVTNHGQISGNIQLGGGDDVFKSHGGDVAGAIYGSTGDDTFITDDGSVLFAENPDEGFDTVKTTDDYQLPDNIEQLILRGSKDVEGRGTAGRNSLTGNVGDNILVGYGGKDTLDGGQGNDLLRGGNGGDTFGFATGYGRDKIADFGDDDRVYLANWQDIQNFRQLKAHAENHGDDLWITAGGDTLIVQNTPEADLRAHDFIF